MKNLALILVTITPFFTTFSSEKLKPSPRDLERGQTFNVSFRDGTSLAVGIFNKQGFKPDKDGVILTVKNKIYLHHYPVTNGSMSVPSYYYNGPNPYGISNCSPARISFFHFETFSLLDVRERVLRMDIPVKKKIEAIKGIDRAMSLTPPKVMTHPAFKNEKNTKKWQRWAETYVARRIEIGQVVWGKDLESLKKNNLMNEGRAFAKK